MVTPTLWARLRVGTAHPSGKPALDTESGFLFWGSLEAILSFHRSGKKSEPEQKKR